jgi:(p)ppGpp synthase/HD superfamily hydrolase
MQILAGMNADINLLIAGLLHDVVEDTEVGIDEIRNKFGEDVANLVAGHTEDKTKTWQERKEHAIEETLLFDIRMKKLILADKLANMRSIHKDYREIGDQLWSRFNAGKEKQEWYYGKMIESLASAQEDEDADRYYGELKRLYGEVFE